MLYSCEKCNYYTNNHSNYKKHLETSKHIRKNGLKPIMSNNGDLYFCQYCNKCFRHKQSVYRHINTSCRKIDRDEDMELQDLKKLNIKDIFIELLRTQKELIKDKKITHKMLEKITNNQQINIGIQNNYTVNNSNYVLNFINYQQADSMNYIKDKFRLTEEEFIQANVSYKDGYYQSLLKKVENNIIKPYLETQDKRPMHTVDSSRKKALYKDNYHTNWTYYPKITLDECFNEFHQSALRLQDIKIKENSKIELNTEDDIIYRQIYFVPRNSKDLEYIYKEVKNYIYKNTKVNRIIKEEDIQELETNNILELIYHSK